MSPSLLKKKSSPSLFKQINQTPSSVLNKKKPLPLSVTKNKNSLNQSDIKTRRSSVLNKRRSQPLSTTKNKTSIKKSDNKSKSVLKRRKSLPLSDTKYKSSLNQLDNKKRSSSVQNKRKSLPLSVTTRKSSVDQLDDSSTQSEEDIAKISQSPWPIVLIESAVMRQYEQEIRKMSADGNEDIKDITSHGDRPNTIFNQEKEEKDIKEKSVAKHEKIEQKKNIKKEDNELKKSLSNVEETTKTGVDLKLINPFKVRLVDQTEITRMLRSRIMKQIKEKMQEDGHTGSMVC